ncbi:uroporphyrinogen decarboxylase [Hydrogenoanaerobacterium saccharovorans]|uniref:Uroporphyrinogen decarboxylase n=1 Tax=Hydrogenoanaerobacterium saccharovorans TaxID=474960 RepID=A0A1H8BSN4_9FIRM|nr:uroporphyrinogen decarboxylase family protein [Hydrogenoanaerobacterium saccharovorans]RPF47257.1 uroporphyrinogen decarboxylase [Hydrogenoanaerobacterium saccharovorans]SEM85772.1 uroporphyrinogen decarboxylase [Hydrogenoanaerobacterium saccharovorans]
MTGYERITAVINGKKTDRVPMMLHNFMAAAGEAGMSMGEYRRSPQNIAKAHIAAARKYGLDGILLDIDTCMEADAIGVPIDFPDDEPARAIGAASKDIDALIELMTPDKLLKNDRIKIMLEAVYLIKKEVGNDLLVRGNCDQMAFSLAMLSYGMSDFMADLLDEDCEEKILQLIDRAYAVHLEYHKLMHQAGADLTSFGDSSCGPDLISRDCYMKFSYPFQKRLQQDLEKMNIKTVCHICGNLDNIIEDVAEIRFSAIEVDYKTNIHNAAKVLDGKSVMFGPIDPSGVFYFGTPQRVAEETQKVLEAFDGKRLVIGAGCALPTGTPKANIRAFTETVKNF